MRSSLYCALHAGATALLQIPAGRLAKRRDQDGESVFLMRVSRQPATWPEQAGRGTRWCDLGEAALTCGLRDAATLATYGG